MPAQISLHAASRTYGPRLVLDSVSVSVSPGNRIGVVRANGAGKSTLLRLLAGALVVVSHDRCLRERWTRRRVILQGGRVVDDRPGQPA